MNNQNGFWVVVPAAGTGSRVAADRPKQYLQLAGNTVLDITLANLLSHPRIQGVIIALAQDDDYFSHSPFASDERVKCVTGGQERSHSVINGLKDLTTLIDLQQPVLVHDAARPCVSHGDLDRLIDAGLECSDGAVLGAKVRDSMKSVDADGKIDETVPRDRLWHAYTPQMFPLGKLIEALERCDSGGRIVTDESSAMENCGFSPAMVAGSSHNLKITFKQDLAVAAIILQQEGRLAQ